MATQWTAGTTAGQVLTAATLNTIGAAWETYTPVWSSTGTAPVLGNGTITGRYGRINKTVWGTINITTGSTTTYGTGIYTVTLPFNQVSNTAVQGYGILFDASASFIGYPGVITYNAAGNVTMRFGNAVGDFTPTVPITLAQSDQIRIFFMYEAS